MLRYRATFRSRRLRQIARWRIRAKKKKRREEPFLRKTRYELREFSSPVAEKEVEKTPSPGDVPLNHTSTKTTTTMTRGWNERISIFFHGATTLVQEFARSLARRAYDTTR